MFCYVEKLNICFPIALDTVDQNEYTWCAGVSQNVSDDMVRTKQGTQGSEWTWYFGVSQNRELKELNGRGVLGLIVKKLIQCEAQVGNSQI